MLLYTTAQYLTFSHLTPATSKRLNSFRYLIKSKLNQQKQEQSTKWQKCRRVFWFLVNDLKTCEFSVLAIHQGL